VSGAHILVVGAGGNIGSHLVPHLGRMSAVALVTLVDDDTYEASNLAGQDVTPRDVGRPKAAVQSARLRTINPAIQVIARPEPIEALPLGDLRADVILACLDSRAARQYVNESAWRLGVPWIDAGVQASQLLARVNVYRPAAEAPCLECAWDEHDYAALEQLYPCGGNSRAGATNAPSSLGSFAAALQAIECQKLLTGSPVNAISGRQVLIDLANHKQFVTSYRRNPSCHLIDHEPWIIGSLSVGPRDLTASAALDLKGAATGRGVGIAGARVSTRRVCTACVHQNKGMRFVRTLVAAAGRCSQCGGQLKSLGSDLMEELTPEMLSGRLGRRSMASLGARSHDILIVRTARGEAYFEIDGDRR
jgi:molybdopterin/thiamine biosynthesis adenylyltransferase